ncbi:hypothetical protein SAMN05443667_104203 [Flavobacterium gillisiae]|uniref:Uncharacterized protein n=1 Tax=Flavobacterium gillisiae TaxID=150146 RepID=A0A1H4B5T8_9FLAO|nr:hypothetical protein [Flavobacterium gillisiae]SEA43573.1 hypothetical protein SAMN05443667_104203 [Flavobacterium gillisiae]|tara:strand:+ start:246 stop:506 length:261 start_codon:yes stop_codon:yes gene_type:complete
MKSEWIATYEGSEIKVTNGWFTGEKLFINNELQDEQLNFITPSQMTGKLKTKNGAELNIKTNLSGFFSVSCRLFVDNKKVELQQTK